MVPHGCLLCDKQHDCLRVRENETVLWLSMLLGLYWKPATSLSNSNLQLVEILTDCRYWQGYSKGTMYSGSGMEVCRLHSVVAEHLHSYSSTCSCGQKCFFCSKGLKGKYFIQWSVPSFLLPVIANAFLCILARWHASQKLVQTIFVILFACFFPIFMSSSIMMPVYTQFNYFG